MRDEVGSVIATVTENLGGVNQSLSLASYGAWGKARPTSGGNAYQDPAPGTFFSPTPAGQEEGYAGHDNLSDTGLVDMEGRIYDPEVGTFLSPDPNVQYPFSSQGYERYSYVNDNPLSLSDPSGYFSLNEAGIGQLISDAGPFFNVIPVCAYWCTAAAEAVGGYMQSGNNLGAGLRAGVLSFGESYAFTYVGNQFAPNPVGTDLVERSVIEGLVGGAFSEAGGGNFGDGFIGAFTSSELSPVISSVYSGNNYYSPQNMATRAITSAIAGGTVSALTGGKFSDAAIAAAFQNMFNDESNRLEGRAIAFSHGMTVTIIYPDGSIEVRTGGGAWRANNPVDVESGNFANRHGAIGETEVEGGQKIAIFVNEEVGWEAARALITGSTYGSLSVNDAVAKWIHGSDAHTEAELSDIDRKIGFSSSLIINSLGSSQIGILLDNMAYWEGYFKPGVDYYLRPGSIL